MKFVIAQNETNAKTYLQILCMYRGFDNERNILVYLYSCL